MKKSKAKKKEIGRFLLRMGELAEPTFEAAKRKKQSVNSFILTAIEEKLST